MRAFRISYILTLSFLLMLAVITLTLGFFPPPAGSKAPEYPKSTSYPSSTDQLALDAYNKRYTEYNEKLKKYEEEQKDFVQEKIVPYAQKVFMGWVIAVVVLQIVGIFMVQIVSQIVGASYTFSGVWAVFFGPLGGLLWFVNSLVSGFAGRANQQYSMDPIFQTVGLTAVVGIIVLTTLGLVYFRTHKSA